MEDDHGRARLVGGEDLGTLLHDHRSLRLAVLNSCEGARGDRADPFSGTAQSLIQQGIPAVVAMQFEITDDAAITFGHVLYEAIADGYPLDAATAEARKAIYADGNLTEWGTPVLYSRAPDGRIFDIQDRPPPALPPSSSPHLEEDDEQARQARREAEEQALRQAEEQAQEAQERGRRETGVQSPQLRQPKIFLCYRRKDTQGFARGIYDRLAGKYGHEQVYRDIDSTPAGVRFSTWIESRVGQCNVMLVLIGDAWFSVQDRTGQRSLDSPKDWVRQEIETALKRDVPIIPVRVQGAPMPSEDELPPSIADLTGFQSAEITDSRWDFDIGLLIQAIDRLITSD